MPYIREPILTPVSIEELHPTQITVGMREVEDKRKRLQARPAGENGQVSRRSYDTRRDGAKKASIHQDHPGYGATP